MHDKNIIKKYKLEFISIFFILASIVVIFKVLLPIVDSFQSVRSDIAKKEESTKSLQQTVDILTSISESDLNTHYNLAATALPQGKNLLLIYNELVSASNKAGVELSSLTIEVGEVYSKVKKDVKRPPTIGSPSLRFDIKAEGQAENMQKLARELYKTIPLLEIDQITLTASNGELSANFFYNPIVFRTGDVSSASKPLDASELSLLDQLKTWNVTTEAIVEEEIEEGATSPTVSSAITPSPTAPSPTTTPSI